MGNRCADHVTPLYPQKLALNSPTGGGRSVGIVRSRTKATEFSFSLILGNDQLEAKLLDFTIRLLYSMHYGPGVDSASNRNDNQEDFLGVNAVGA